ncbi:MAG: tRNA (guanosine(37)-N1)-methyltransferase TrmD [Acidobacteriota bacterium]
MIFSVISIFPQMIDSFAEYGLIGKAAEKNLISIRSYDLRDFSDNKHKKTDDRPYGGGAGMVMTPGPLYNAIKSVKAETDGKVILFSPYAEKLSQNKVKELSKEKHLILVCGRYEGIDQRIIDNYIDEEISIGDYVIMGGELAAGILIEGVSRMVDGVVGNRESVETDSFYFDDQFGFPQYTMPRDFRGFSVPEVLLSGDHKKINEWRKKKEKKRK